MHSYYHHGMRLYQQTPQHSIKGRPLPCIHQSKSDKNAISRRAVARRPRRIRRLPSTSTLQCHSLFCPLTSVPQGSRRYSSHLLAAPCPCPAGHSGLAVNSCIKTTYRSLLELSRKQLHKILCDPTLTRCLGHTVKRLAFDEILVVECPNDETGHILPVQQQDPNLGNCISGVKFGIHDETGHEST